MFGAQRAELRLKQCPALLRGEACKVPGCIYKHDTAKPLPPRVTASPLVGRKQKLATHHSRPMGTRPGLAVVNTGIVKSKNASSAAPVTAKISKSLMPVVLDQQPVAFNYRCQMLASLADQLKKKGGCEDVEQTAVEIEMKIAKLATTVTYPQEIRNAVKAIRRGEYMVGYAEEAAKRQAQTELELLRKGLEERLLPPSKLQFYVTQVPEVKEKFDYDKKYECERCRAPVSAGEVIQSFTEVAEGKRSTTDFICRFHLQRRNWNPETRKLRDTFPCCGENTTDAPGCEQRSVHVYKLSDTQEMHAMIPFREISTASSETAEFAVALDCEMAYTTKGMELIRLSVLSWDTGLAIFDRLVYPQGDIIDLNTRWSGVSDIGAGTEMNGKHFPTLKFEECLAEFNKLVDKNTIIVGHGLENDLNTMRLAHGRIADTVRTYPRHGTRLRKLKDLTWQYLSREIQAGEHDSFEDALAAMDILKADILGKLPKEKPRPVLEDSKKESSLPEIVQEGDKEPTKKSPKKRSFSSENEKVSDKKAKTELEDLDY